MIRKGTTEKGHWSIGGTIERFFGHDDFVTQLSIHFGHNDFVKRLPTHLLKWRFRKSC